MVDGTSLPSRPNTIDLTPCDPCLENTRRNPQDAGALTRPKTETDGIFGAFFEHLLIAPLEVVAKFRIVGFARAYNVAV